MCLFYKNFSHSLISGRSKRASLSSVSSFHGWDNIVCSVFYNIGITKMMKFTHILSVIFKRWVKRKMYTGISGKRETWWCGITGRCFFITFRWHSRTLYFRCGIIGSCFFSFWWHCRIIYLWCGITGKIFFHFGDIAESYICDVG